MGFRHLHSFNLALLGKHGWNLLSQPYSLVARLLKAKYYPHDGFFEAKLGHNPSFIWGSVWVARRVITTSSRWRLGNGTDVNVWPDPWIKDIQNFKPTTPIIEGLEDLKVVDLSNQHCWNLELVGQFLMNMMYK